MRKAATTLLRFVCIVFILCMAKDDKITIISNLLALHKENCGTLPLCAFNKWNISADVTYPCCKQCSCHKDCSKDDVCCLDNWIHEGENLNHIDVIAYWEFMQIMNGNQVKDDNGTDTEEDIKRNTTNNYVTVAKLIIRAYDSILTNTGNQRAVNSSTRTFEAGLQHCNGIPNWTVFNQLSTPARDTICVSAKLKNRDILYSHPWNDVGYEMITSCFSNETDQVTNNQCVNLTITRNMDIRILIPVTSMTSFKTYRNIYCLQCNEGDHKTFSVWKTWYTCDRPTVAQRELDSDKWWLIDRFFLYSCNIVFEPSELVKNFVMKCKELDSESCSGINGVLHIDQAVLEDICNCFNLPVFQINNNIYNVYGNVACYLCNRERFLGKSCSTYIPNNNHQLEINTKVSFDNDPDAGINQLFSTNCKIGFIYDNMTNSCRRVFCPRNFINVNGVYTPFLLQTRNVFYSVVITVKVKKQLVSDVGLLDELQSNFVNQMRTEAKYKFSESCVSVWRGDDNLYINIMLNVKPYKKAYYETINNIDDFIWKILVYRVRGKLSEDETELNIPGERFLPSLEIRQQLSERNISNRASYWKEIEFRLDETFFCPRVELNGSEIQRKGRWTYKLQSGKIVADPELTSRGSFYGYLICVKDVFPEQFLNAASALRPHQEVLANSYQSNVLSSQPLTSPFLVVVVLLFVMVVVLGVRKCMRYRLAQNACSDT